MARETQTTRALREHASNLKAPSQRVIRYLRGFIDNRPYTTLPSSNIDIHELEELQRAGLWPPQTCNGTRKAWQKEREELDVCGISAREDKAVKKVVKGGLQGRQPELRLDYEDASIIRKNRRRISATLASHSTCLSCPGSQSMHSDATAGTRALHTSAKRTRPSHLVTRPLLTCIKDVKAKKRKNDWQYGLAEIGRREAEARKHGNPLLELQHPVSTAIDSDNWKLSLRLSRHQLSPAYGRVAFKDANVLVGMQRAMAQQNYHEAIRLFYTNSSTSRRMPANCVSMCADAYLKIGRVASARAVMEKFKTSRPASKGMMVLQLRSLLDRYKVDSAIAFVRMAKGLGAFLTDTLLEGLRKLRVTPATLQQAFDLAESLVPESQASHYTILIQGYIDDNQLDLASEWLQKMRVAGHTPDNGIYNSMLTAAAEQGRWDEITPMINLVHGSAIKASTSSMNKVLSLAADVPSQSIASLHALSERLGAQWNISTWNTMLKATITRSPAQEMEATIMAFFQKMADAGVQPNHVTTYILLTSIENSGYDSPGSLRRLLSTTHGGKSRVNTESQTKEVLLRSMLHHAPTKTTLEIIQKDIDTVTPNPIARRMAACLRELRPVDTLKIFHGLIAQSIRPTNDILLLAIKALFLLPHQAPMRPGITAYDKAVEQQFHAQCRSSVVDRVLELSARHRFAIHTELSADAWAFLSAVFSYRLSKSDVRINTGLSRAPTQEVLFEVYRFYDKHKLRNPHHPLMVAATILHNRRQYHAVVELVRAVTRSDWGVRQPLNIIALTILLKAYMALRDAMGVRWVVEHLAEREVEPDDVFLKVLKGQKKVSIDRLTLDWNDTTRAVVEDSIRLCEELKARIAEKRRRGSQLICKVLQRGGEEEKVEKVEKGQEEEPEETSDPGRMLVRLVLSRGELGVARSSAVMPLNM